MIDLGAVFGFRMELFIDPNEVGGGEQDAVVFPEINLTNDNPASGTAGVVGLAVLHHRGLCGAGHQAQGQIRELQPLGECLRHSAER